MRDAGTQFGDGLATALDKIKALLPKRALNYFDDLDENLLVKTGGNISHSARLSGIGRASLQKIIRRLGIATDRFR